MAGLLNQGGKLTPESVRAQMHVTPQQGQMLDRIVLAGQKVMFSQKSHRMFLDQLKGPGTIGMKLGQGVAGLMGLLLQESKNSLPPNLVIPAGIVLLAHAAEFLRKSGMPVDVKDIAEGIKVMTSAIVHAAGLDPDKIGATKAAPAAQPGAQA